MGLDSRPFWLCFFLSSLGQHGPRDGASSLKIAREGEPRRSETTDYRGQGSQGREAKITSPREVMSMLLQIVNGLSLIREFLKALETTQQP